MTMYDRYQSPCHHLVNGSRHGQQQRGALRAGDVWVKFGNAPTHVEYMVQLALNVFMIVNSHGVFLLVSKRKRSAVVT